MRSQFVPPADGIGHNICLLMPNAHREVAVKVKPTAVKWCIIEMKGHKDIRVSLFTLTAVTDSGGRPSALGS